MYLNHLGCKNRHALTHIFSAQQAAPFSNAQGCANGLFHSATKNYMADHNTMREAQLHDDRKSYGSEPEAIFPFPGEAAGHKNGPLLHRKFMWQDRHSATQRSPTVQAVYSKQAENLLVGKTKSYWTNNTPSSRVFVRSSI